MPDDQHKWQALQLREDALTCACAVVLKLFRPLLQCLLQLLLLSPVAALILVIINSCIRS